MDAHELSGLLLDTKALKFNVSEPFTFASGIKSPVYMNCRILISDVKKRQQVVEELAKAVGALDPDMVAGTATAGIPWGSWAADMLGLPLVIVGGGCEIAGKLSGNAVIVEDLVSTGGSSISAVAELREAGAEVTDCVSIFSYGLGRSEEAFREADVRLHPLATFDKAIEVAQARDYLSPEESEEAKMWAVDTERWRR